MKADAIATTLFFASLSLMITAGICAILNAECEVVFALASIYTALAALFLLMFGELRR